MRKEELSNQFSLSLQQLQRSFEQLDLLYRQTRSENELLWELIYEHGHDDLIVRLLDGLVELYSMESIPKVFHHMKNSLSLKQFSHVAAGLQHLLRNPYWGGNMNGETIQSLFTSLINRIFSAESDETDALDELYFDTLKFVAAAIEKPFEESIHLYLLENYDRITQTIIETNSPNIILAYIRCLLAYDLFSFLESLFELLLEAEWPFLDANLDEKQFAQFLWYAHYVDQDVKLIKVSKDSLRYLNQSTIAEIQLYQEYYALRDSKAPSAQALKTMETLLEKGQLFCGTEKEKIWGKLRKEIQTITEAAAGTETLLTEATAKTIWQVKNKTIYCPHCPGSVIQKKHFVVEGTAKGKQTIEKRILFELLLCNSCNRVFAYDEMKLMLYRAIEPYRVTVQLDPVDYPPNPKKTIASSQPTKQAMVSPTSVKPLISNTDYFSWPNTEAKESEGRSSQQGNFRTETDLHRLGYQITGLTRRKRWDILVSKGISTMPLKEIVYTIARNVRLRKSQIGGRTKYAYAIAEWEHDLKRLKEEYYRNNFTWPQY
ncbi:hypothetical protein PP175_04020 [Aneurinibacillus sp. Ricciae_BoGa-3]|uniref:hypothetical protein n=1 Tax=Aneurinibacillus sp. Ricciae_BoGa-3 TaxID=3022697 RepID=UPI0023419BA3|nr:hypothetical protein [Aneurinibacillus sp. Ricciae_BoGa-3]WCK55162.1 hypothetical protein PP175_04020 [Aneurinibacillus sp. Ricciae_BoGa-3]